MKIKTAGFSLIAGVFLIGAVIIGMSSLNLTKTTEIQTIWFAFEEDRNDKLKALIALRSEIGYGGMVHRFKNYILRQKISDKELIISNIGGARAALKRYQALQLSTTEDRALLQVEQTLKAYRKALDIVTVLIGQNKTPTEIDNVVKINDMPALEALETLEIETNFNDAKNLNSQSQPLLLSALRNAMGYGGLIHNFKNYVLRHTPETRIQVKSKAEQIKVLVEMYKHYRLTDIEIKALQKIVGVMNEYEDKLPIIDSMINEGQLAGAIDKQVVVDDMPALDGFKDLQKQLIIHNEARAYLLDDALHIVQITGKGIFFVTIISFLCLIGIAIWLCFYKITQPISKLTAIMLRLAKNDLDVEIYGTEQSNEIGAMARTVEVFKDNAIQKRKTEQALKSANENLEEKVFFRTQELKTNEARLTALVENAVDSIITIDHHGIIQTFNAAAIAMFGYPSHEVVGKNVSILMPNPYKSEHDNYLINYLRTNEKKIIGKGREVAGQRKNGDIFPIELAVSEVDLDNGTRIFTGIIRDLSEYKDKEKELRITKETAEKANQAKSEFLSSMSHELRTPLNAVLGFSELLATDTESPLNDEQLESVQYIIQSGHHLLGLIDDVLDLSRIESGNTEVSIEAIDCERLLQQVCVLMKPQAEKRSITILNNTLDLPPLMVMADKIKLKQVILNFLSNAIKYNNENGTVTLSYCKTENGHVRINVTDSGDGVSVEQLPKLFEPFNRLDMENSEIQGTGIGLTICKQLIELMNGEIGVFHNQHCGLTFWVEFDEA